LGQSGICSLDTVSGQPEITSAVGTFGGVGLRVPGAMDAQPAHQRIGILPER